MKRGKGRVLFEPSMVGQGAFPIVSEKYSACASLYSNMTSLRLITINLRKIYKDK